LGNLSFAKQEIHTKSNKPDGGKCASLWLPKQLIVSRCATSLYVVLPDFTVEVVRRVFLEVTDELSKPRGVNSMKTKWMVVASVLALLLCGAAMVAYAQGPGPEGMGGHHGMGGPGHGMGFMARELNLSDAQKEQVKTIMKANHANMKPIMQQMEQNRQALLTATANGAYDPAKIQALANQQAQLQAAITVQHEALKHQIYTQVLTSEQQAKAEQLRTQEINRITEHLQKMATATDAAPPSE
jgi:periplasmic protein CpxP/Spy